MFDRIRMIMGSGSIQGYFLQVVPITCLVCIVYAAVRLIFLKHNNHHIQWFPEIMKFLFVGYLTGLFNLIVMPANFWLYFFDGITYGRWEGIVTIFDFGGFNLTPSIIKWLQGDLAFGSWVKEMLIGNITMFMPLGFFLPFITQKFSIKNIWAVAILVPLAMELLQTIFGRSFDIDDLICNFVGIIIGFFIAFFIKKQLRKSVC